jgi:hypothetical protein
MTPHITKNRHQESNLAAPHAEEDTAFSGENEGDTQANEAPNENEHHRRVLPWYNKLLVVKAIKAIVSIGYLTNDVG